ncbi:hypothetical protein TNCV_1236341 [Trichonephila clavipes]|nr:hypothetical protein TNCV_1236341 [Trichonephila clavipes]
MSAIADFKKMEVGKTFGTGLPSPSEEPPRLNFAQNERCSLRYWPACSVPIGREKTAPVDFRSRNPVFMYSTTRRSWCDVESPARSRVVGELKCRYR